MREILTQIDRWEAEGEEVAMATLVGGRGPSPRPPGARLWLTRSGRLAGSVSGGCVEGDVLERAQRVLDEERPQLAFYASADEAGLNVGLSCGGAIEVLIEPFRACPAWQALRAALEQERAAVLCTALAPAELLGARMAVLGAGVPIGGIASELDSETAALARQLLGVDDAVRPHRVGSARILVESFVPRPRLVIVGATDTGVALCRMAKDLGYRVSVIDARHVWTTRERFPDADDLILDWPDSALAQLGLDAGCYVVTLAHDVKFDLPALEAALRSGVAYVGALGSRRTHARREAGLRERGFGDADLGRIHAPIGLDIGARTPEEIALAILAEMTVVHRRRSSAPDGGAPSQEPGSGRREGCGR